MNDLISYIQNYLRTPSKSVATRTGGVPSVPGRSLQAASGPPIIDGEWSEVPKGLSNGGKVYKPGTGIQRTYGEFSEVPKALAGPAGKKALSTLAARAGGGSMLEAMLGPFGGLIAAGDGRPDNSSSDMQGLTDAYKAARTHSSVPAGEVTSAPLPPVGVPRAGEPGAPSVPISQSNYTPPPAAAPELPWWASGDMTKMFPGASQAPAAAPQAAPVPMPRARPAQASAPQAPAQESQPDTSFFMRNAMMMRDPASGELIDPQGAASVRGPDLISKMMTYLHNK